MRTTGIVRRMDDIGRVVIPKELRKQLNISAGDPLEIFITEQGDLVYRKYYPIKQHEWGTAKSIVSHIIPSDFILVDRYGEVVAPSTKRTRDEFVRGYDIRVDGDVEGRLLVCGDCEISEEKLLTAVKIIEELFTREG